MRLMDYVAARLRDEQRSRVEKCFSLLETERIGVELCVVRMEAQESVWEAV